MKNMNQFLAGAEKYTTHNFSVTPSLLEMAATSSRKSVTDPVPNCPDLNKETATC